MQVVKGLHSLVHYRRDIARPRTVNFLSRAAGEDFWKQRVVRLPAREPPHPPTPSLPTTVHLAFRFVSDETRQKQDCNLHGTGCPASPGSKVPYPMHSRRSNNAYQVRPVTGQYTHTHTLTLTHPHRHVRIRVHVSIFHQDTHKFGFLRVMHATTRRRGKC